MTGINIGGVAAVPSTVLLAYEKSYLGGGTPPDPSRPGIWTLSSPAFAPAFVTATGADPIVSPDGTKIAYRNGSDLYVIDPDGSNDTLLDLFPPAGISWHPDSSKIIYRPTSAVIRTIKPDGTDQTDLIFKSNLFQPVYNFDGSRIAFYVEKSGSTPDELWIMDADGSNATKVADGVNYPGGGPGSRGQISELTWARTQDVLAYYKTDGGVPPSASTWLINGDGTGETQITSSGGNVSPGRWAWAPDDSVMAGDGSAGTTLYLIDPAGGGATSLGITRWNSGGGGPEVWGDRIFYIGGTNEANVMSCALDGTDIQQHDGDDLSTMDTSLVDSGR